MNKNQVILITGASSGIGKAAALQLCREGHKVYAAARRLGEMQDINDAGGQTLKMDITREEDVQNTVSKVIEAEGRIDVLINNAGYGVYGPVEEVPLDIVRRMYEVNLFGLGRITQLTIPHMRKAGKGRIINVSSMGGKIYMPLGAWYHGSKHAVEGWSDSLRVELKAFNIDVVIIEPGIISTEFGDEMIETLLKISAKGPYARLVQAFARESHKSYHEGGGSPPELIARVISKAVRARRPKIRYAAGKFAKLMIFVRKWMGDRIFDKIIMSQLK